MVLIQKVAGVLSCGFLLCLGLSTAAQAGNAASAADELKGGRLDRKGGPAGLTGEEDKLNGGHMIIGEVLRVEGNDCFVKGQDGKEVRLHIDVTTLKAINIEPGDRIEVTVNEQNHALAINKTSMN